MMSSVPARLRAIPLSVLAALLLGLVPLPEPVQPLRPYWLALVAAFWMIETPQRTGLGFAFMTGLLADLVFGSVLGEQALRLLVIAFVVRRSRAQLQFFPLFQQTLGMGLLLFVDRIILALLYWMLGQAQLPWPFWLAPLVGMGLWVPVCVLLERLSRYRKSAK